MRPTSRSLPEVHRTVSIPQAATWFKRLFAFSGPAYMVSVGYMDPGNWATDLEGGARFGYQLIWVLLMSNLMAVLLQTLAARLGLATGRDLAQACRDGYPRPVGFVLWFLCEIAIAACDLAEVLGTAIGLNLLFGVPLVWAVILTGFDTFLLLALQRYGIRKMEAFILALVATVGGCFVIEVFLSKPSWGGVVRGFVPRLDGESLYVAIGILGATVMPHNLYLHSALVQSRNVDRTESGIRAACRFNLIDSAVALNLAFFVNASILVVAAADFHANGIVVTEIQQAHEMLHHVLGTTLAPIAFAIALLCAGQSSTLTGTLAGQIVMEGFLNIKLRPWIRRLVTRSIAIVPSVVVIVTMGESGTYRLLILSQVVLSLQLPFAVVPLIRFTSNRRKMGPFANPAWTKRLAWTAAAIIIGLNAYLVGQSVQEWIVEAGEEAWIIRSTVVPIAVALGGLLLWMIFRQDERERVHLPSVSAKSVYAAATQEGTVFRRIGVALDASPEDAAMLREALALASAHDAELVLIHIVEGVGGQWYGELTADSESRLDEDYIRELAERIRSDTERHGKPISVVARLGFGTPSREIARMAQEEALDLLIVGGHGHRFLSDLFRGSTITRVRHALSIPILAVRGEKSAKPASTEQTPHTLDVPSSS